MYVTVTGQMGKEKVGKQIYLIKPLSTQSASFYLKKKKKGQHLFIYSVVICVILAQYDDLNCCVSQSAVFNLVPMTFLRYLDSNDLL